VTGAIDRASITITLNRDVDLKCYPPVAEFLKFLTEVLTGEAQGSFGDVVISNLTPESDDVNKLWIEVNGQRNQFTQKMYINGKWETWYFVPPQSYVLFDGRTTLPTGFVEVGRFKSGDVPVTKNGVTLTTPAEFIIASFQGY
jgi:hypothetical protein